MRSYKTFGKHFFGISLAAFLIISFWVYAGWSQFFEGQQAYSYEAEKFIVLNNITEPVYNAYNKDSIFEELETLESVTEVETILEKYQVNGLIINRQEKSFLEYVLLAEESWSLVYLDDVSAIFVRDIEEHQKVIGKHAYTSLYPIGLMPVREGANTQEAIKEYRRALEINPHFAGGYRDLALIYQHLGEDDLAVKTMFEAIDVASKENKIFLGRIYTDLANIYAKGEEWTEAETYYKKTLKLNPENLQALNNLGLIYTSFQMDKENALKNLRTYRQVLEEKDKQGFKELVKHVTGVIEEVEKNGPQPRPERPEPGFVQAGVFKKYSENPLSRLDFRFDSIVPNPNAHGSYQYGISASGSAGSTGISRYMVLWPINDTNVRIRELVHYCNANGLYRMALYEGSTTGADKKYDTGELNNTSGAGWYTSTLPTPYDLSSSSATTSIAWKQGTTGQCAYQYLSTGTSDGNIYEYWDNTTPEAGTDTSVAFQQTSAPNALYDSYRYTHHLVYVRYPTISSVTPSSFNDTETGIIIAGDGFYANKNMSFPGTPLVEICANSDHSGTCVTQTDTAWGDDSITFTAVQGALSTGTNYVFVTNDDDERNATGYSITFSGVDSTAPTPSPMTWAVNPDDLSASSIDMTSTTGSDSTTPVEYLFTNDNTDCGVNAGTGGTNSSWQSADTTYTDSGLQVNKCYGYTVTARDSVTPTPNTGTASSRLEAYTTANTPGTPTLSGATQTTLDLDNAENSNPSSNPTTNFAVYVSATSPTDSNWDGQWVNTSSEPAGSEVWMTDVQADALVLGSGGTALVCGTTYDVQIKARNGDGDATALSTADSVSTSACTPPTITTSAASSITVTTATLNGDITATGGANATDRGFAYGTDLTLATVISTTTDSGSFGTGTFTFGASSLTCNTTYYNRAYATNPGGTGYGTIVSFSTSACDPPTVTSDAASSITVTSATLNGDITATGGANATDRGFAYGTDSTLATVIATTTDSGSFGTGTYTFGASSLTCGTTYYNRAYATNPNGTGYGTIDSFTTSACVTVTTTGTQTANMDTSSTDQYVGGNFVITENFSSRNVTGITITEHGSVDAQNDLSNIRLYYETSADCSGQSFSGFPAPSESLFGSATTFSAANGVAVFTGTVAITTSSEMCVYAVVDVDSTASNGQTLDIRITDPSSEVTVSGGGNVEPGSPVSISGSTTINDTLPTVPTLEDTPAFPNLNASTTEPWIGGFASNDPEDATVGFELAIDDNFDFSSPVVSTISGAAGWNASSFSNNATTSYKVQAGALVDGTTYWWRVNAYDVSDTSLKSASTTPRSFTIDTPITLDQWFQTTGLQFEDGTLTSSVSTTTGGVEVGEGGSDWYDGNWLYRRPIVIQSSVVSTTTDSFPILAATTLNDLKFTSHGGKVASSTGLDILFTDSDGTTLLDYEQEFYASTTGEIAYWVETAISSSVDKTIYMYYGYASASDLSNANGVWDDNYILVQHLNETSGTHFDSTGNGNNSTSVSVTNQDETGITDGADHFDNDFIEFSNTGMITSAGTVSVWFKEDIDPATVDEFVFAHRTASTDNRIYMRNNLGVLEIRFRGEARVSLGDLSAGWHQVALSWSGADYHGKLDDGVQTSNTAAGSLPSIQGQVVLGSYISLGTGQNLDGIIDEFRISDIERTDAWIETGYNNQSNVATFLDIQAEETDTGGGTGTILGPVADYDWLFSVDSNDNWGEASFSTTETQGDVKLQVWYASSTEAGDPADGATCDSIIPDSALTGNSSSFDVSASPIDLSGASFSTTTYNRICLQATLTYGASASPTLDDWKIRWDLSSVSPTVSSAANQSFAIGDSATAISPITVTENAFGVSITAANDLRIAIATSTVDMLWDTTDTSASFSGTAWTDDVTSNTVSYEGGGSVLVISVANDFEVDDTLIIDGLSYTSFGTVNAAASAIDVFTGGATDQTSDADDDKTVAIKGTLTIGGHDTGQEGNKLDITATSVTAGELFSFKLTPSGESVNLTQLKVVLKNIKGFITSDVTNAKLTIDYDGDGAIEAGDLEVGGAGSVSISGATGTITFSSAFATSTARNYILTADIANISGGRQMLFEEVNTNTKANLFITSTGVTSSLSITPTRAASGVLPGYHIRALGLAGGTLSTPSAEGAGTQTGGGSGGGEIIGEDLGFRAPTSLGAISNWTSATEAYTSDGTPATASSAQVQEYTTFGFSIPGSNTIVGIELKLEANDSSGGTIGAEFGIGTATTSSATTTVAMTGTDVVYILGGPSYDFGRSWSPGDFNDGTFVLELTANTGGTVSLDAIQVKVYHQASGGGGGGGGEASIPKESFLASILVAFMKVIDVIRAVFS